MVVIHGTGFPLLVKARGIMKSLDLETSPADHAERPSCNPGVTDNLSPRQK